MAVPRGVEDGKLFRIHVLIQQHHRDHVGPLLKNRGHQHARWWRQQRGIEQNHVGLRGSQALRETLRVVQRRQDVEDVAAFETMLGLEDNF